MTTIPDTYQPASWLERAACAEEDPELFHLPGDAIDDPVSEARNADQIGEAKAVCARCPVIAECLAEARQVPANKDRWAIAGNTTPRERTRIRRRASRSARGVPDDETDGVS